MVSGRKSRPSPKLLSLSLIVLAGCLLFILYGRKSDLIHDIVFKDSTRGLVSRFKSNRTNGYAHMLMNRISSGSGKGNTDGEASNEDTTQKPISREETTGESNKQEEATGETNDHEEANKESITREGARRKTNNNNETDHKSNNHAEAIVKTYSKEASRKSKSRNRANYKSNNHEETTGKSNSHDEARDKSKSREETNRKSKSPQEANDKSNIRNEGASGESNSRGRPKGESNSRKKKSRQSNSREGDEDRSNSHKEATRESHDHQEDSEESNNHDEANKKSNSREKASRESNSKKEARNKLSIHHKKAPGESNSHEGPNEESNSNSVRLVSHEEADGDRNNHEVVSGKLSSYKEAIRKSTNNEKATRESDNHGEAIRKLHSIRETTGKRNSYGKANGKLHSQEKALDVERFDFTEEDHCDSECQRQVQKARKQKIRDQCAVDDAPSTIWDARGHLMEFQKDRLNHLYAVDKSKVIYCSVPKNGCTLWKKRMLIASGLYNSTTLPLENVHPTFEEKMIPLSNYSTIEAERRLKTYDKFLFVRNPLHRLLSLFLDKSVNRREFPFPWLSKYQFSEFLVYILGQEVEDWEPTWGYEEHLASATHLCLPCDVDYSFVGRIETAKRDTRFVIDRYFGDTELVNITLPESVHATHSEGKDFYFRDVSHNLLGAVYRRYRLDNKMFGYRKPHFLGDL